MGDASVLLIGSLPVEKENRHAITNNVEDKRADKVAENLCQTVMYGFLKITFSTTTQENIAPRMQRIPNFNGAQSNQP